MTKPPCGWRLVSCNFFLNSVLFGLDGKPEGKGNLEDPGVDGRIILRWIVRKCDRVWTKSSWLRIGTCGGHL